MALLDPYNLEFLSFSILQELSKLRKVDLLINFSTMDLERNGDLEFDPSVRDSMTWHPAGAKMLTC